MSTVVNLEIRNREAFDRITHGGMPSGESLNVATVDDETCTQSGPLVVIGFSSYEDGRKISRSQFGMRLAQFLQVADALRAAHEDRV